MNVFKSIKYLPDVKELNLHGYDRYTETLKYQPLEKIRSLYGKFVDESQKFNPVNLTSEIKPYTGYYLYSLIKENRFNKILQIGARNGIDSLYLDLGLQNLFLTEGLKDQNSDAKRPRSIDIIQSSKEWNKNIQTTFDGLETKDKKLYLSDSFLVLPEMVEKDEKYNMILLKGNHLFDNSLMDFFYSDKLLMNGGIIVLFDAKFESSQKLAKYIQTNFKNYLMLPKNLGSEYCYTFVKMEEDDRQWFFHAPF
jgi:hypothetical protein